MGAICYKYSAVLLSRERICTQKTSLPLALVLWPDLRGGRIRGDNAVESFYKPSDKQRGERKARHVTSELTSWTSRTKCNDTALTRRLSRICLEAR